MPARTFLSWKALSSELGGVGVGDTGHTQFPFQSQPELENLPPNLSVQRSHRCAYLRQTVGSGFPADKSLFIH